MDSIALTILKKFTARDLQVKIGPSDVADPCTYCLAEKLMTYKDWKAGEIEIVPREFSRYWLAARLGTAVHLDLEHTVENDTELSAFLEPESKVTVTHLDGYGDVKGTLDLFDTSTSTVHDFKTTERAKLVKIKQAQAFMDAKRVPTTLELTVYTLTRYKGQTHLYAYGKENQGCKVTQIVIDFICRDGKTDSDIWATEPMDYDASYAEALIARLKAIWVAVQNASDLNQFNQHRLCYECTNNR